jgi:hypothetical protein
MASFIRFWMVTSNWKMSGPPTVLYDTLLDVSFTYRFWPPKMSFVTPLLSSVALLHFTVPVDTSPVHASAMRTSPALPPGPALDCEGATMLRSEQAAIATVATPTTMRPTPRENGDGLFMTHDTRMRGSCPGQHSTN